MHPPTLRLQIKHRAQKMASTDKPMFTSRHHLIYRCWTRPTDSKYGNSFVSRGIWFGRISEISAELFIFDAVNCQPPDKWTARPAFVLCEFAKESEFNFGKSPPRIHRTVQKPFGLFFWPQRTKNLSSKCLRLCCKADVGRRLDRFKPAK